MDVNSDKQLKALADAIPQPAWMACADGSIEWVNRYWREFSATPSKATDPCSNFDWARGQHPNHVDRVTRGYRHAVETGEPWQDTFPLQDAKGMWRWFRARGTPIRNAAGGIERWFSVYTEITDQVEAAQKLRESEERSRALVNASPFGIVFMDMHGHPTFYNPRCEALHGFGVEQAQGEGWARAVHPEDRQRVVDSWRMACESSQPWAQVYRFLHPDGRTVWVSGRACPMHVGGKQVGYMGALEDITELKLTEAERERLLQQEQVARREAQRATRLRDEVLGIVAHDLRQPLQTLVALSAQMIKAPALPEAASRRDEGQLIRQTVEAMSRLIRDLLDVSTIESGGLVMAPEDIDIDALLRNTVQSFHASATEKGIELRSQTIGYLPRICADPGRLMQVLSNLVGNAIKFTPTGGTVRLEARVHDETIEVSVMDTGSGIPTESLAHIFDRFWQACRAERAGAGLGLAIAKGIIEAHEGRIWAESVTGHGTTMTFTVPLHRAERQSDVKPSLEPSQIARGAPS